MTYNDTKYDIQKHNTRYMITQHITYDNTKTTLF